MQVSERSWFYKAVVHRPLVRPWSDGSFDCLNLSHQKPLVSSSSGRSLALTVGSMERRARCRGGVRRQYAGRATRRQWKRHKKSDGLRRDEHRLEQFELPEIGDYSPAVVFPVSRCSLPPSFHLADGVQLWLGLSLTNQAGQTEDGRTTSDTARQTDQGEAAT